MSNAKNRKREQAKALFKQGEKALQTKSYEEALDLFTKCIRLYPTPNGYFKKALATARCKGLATAIQELDHAIELDPENNEFYYYRALFLFAINEIDYAIKDISRAITITPNKAIYYAERAKYHISNESYESAIVDAATAADMESADTSNKIIYAQVLLKLNKPQQAIDICSQTLLLDPKHSEAFRVRGRAKTMLGDVPGAIQDLKTSVQLLPTTEGYEDLGDLNHSTQEYQEAILNYTKGIDLSPRNYTLYIKRAKANRIMGEHKAAISDLNKYIQLYPSSRCSNSAMSYSPEIASVYLSIAGEHLAIGEHGQAIVNYSKALQHNRYLLEAYLMRGQTRLKTKDYSGAITDLSKTIVHNAEIIDAWIYRSVAKAKAGDWKGAIQDNGKALNLVTSEEQKQVLEEFGRFLLDSSKVPSMPDSQKPILDKQITWVLDPCSAHAHYIRAKTWIEKGRNLEHAKKSLHLALTASPSPFVRKEIEKTLKITFEDEAFV